jgi:hypothetical protein
MANITTHEINEKITNIINNDDRFAMFTISPTRLVNFIHLTSCDGVISICEISICLKHLSYFELDIESTCSAVSLMNRRINKRNIIVKNNDVDNLADILAKCLIPYYKKTVELYNEYEERMQLNKKIEEERRTSILNSIKDRKGWELVGNSIIRYNDKRIDYRIVDGDVRFIFVSGSFCLEMDIDEVESKFKY